MLDTIPVPAQSKFGAAVARRLNASRPIAPAGSLAMSGPTGTGFAPLPKNLRDRRAASSSGLPGCYQIKSIIKSDEENSTSVTIDFANPYFMVGGNIYEGPDSVSFPLGSPKVFVCLKIPADGSAIDDISIEDYATLNDLQLAMKDESLYIVPIYLLANNMTVICDFRTVPFASMWEF